MIFGNRARFLSFSSAVTGNDIAGIPAHGPSAQDRQGMRSLRKEARPSSRMEQHEAVGL